MQLSVLEFAAPVQSATSDPIGGLGIRMDLARDESIYGQGDEAEFVYRVISGLVRTTRLTDDGLERSDLIGQWLYSDGVRERMANYVSR